LTESRWRREAIVPTKRLLVRILLLVDAHRRLFPSTTAALSCPRSASDVERSVMFALVLSPSMSSVRVGRSKVGDADPPSMAGW
jgi:hypothetical protein